MAAPEKRPGNGRAGAVGETSRSPDGSAAARWPEEVYDTVVALLEAIGAPGSAESSHRAAAIRALSHLLAAGRRRHPEAEALPKLTEQLLLGGALAIVDRRGGPDAERDPAEQPAQLARPLAEALLFPYLGPKRARVAVLAAARRERRRRIARFPDLPFTPLPGGRHSIPADRVRADQRQRLLSAATHLVGEGGIDAATVTTIVARAHVSRKTFYEFFSNRADCLDAAAAALAERCERRIRAAAVGAPTWPAQVRAAVESVLELAASHPGIAGLLGAEAMATDASLAARRADLFDRLAVSLRRGRYEPRDLTPELPPAAERVALQGACALVEAHLLRDPQALPALAPEVAELLLASHVESGAEAPAPAPASPVAP